MNWPKDALARKYVEIALVVAAYWAVSISLVFLNKYLLSNKDLKLEAPLFITWFQCVVTVALCIGLSLVSRFSKQWRGQPLFEFDTIRISADEMRQVLPVSVVFICMISFNNLCLKYVDVTFYYIGRSLTTVFNVVLSYLMLQQRTSRPALICCGIIIIGFFLGVDQEQVSGSFSLLGAVFGVLASLFVALNSIYIKKVLNVVRGDVTLLTYYNNVNACLMFPVIFFVFGEIPQLGAFQHFDSLLFWFTMLLGGIFGFAIGYLTSLQVKVTSPLTNNISGTAKACAQTVIASIGYRESRSLLWWIGNFVVLLGSGFYTRVKQQEMAVQAKKAAAIAEDDGKQVKEDQVRLLINSDEVTDQDDDALTKKDSL